MAIRAKERNTYQRMQALTGNEKIVVDGIHYVTPADIANHAPQADMSETDPSSPAYVKNKPSVYTQTEIQQLIAGFITKSVNDLTNYYLKTDTYTKTEVQQLLSALKQFSYESVAVLPAASAQTMHKIYLVPSGTSESQNTKDEYITILESGSYAWEKIGSTAIDLSGYVTTTYLTSALAGYTTTSALSALLEGKADKSTTFTKTEINGLISGFITKSANDLVNYYKKSEVDGLISGFITKSVSDLANYYLKTDTYTKTEVQQLLSALKQFSYESVAVLPAASAQTMHKIYLVSSGTSESQNTKNEYITLLDNGSYVWEKIGSTAIDLSGYVTLSVLNLALSGYVTSDDLSVAVHPDVGTSIPQGGLLPDAFYSLGELTGTASIPFAAPVSGKVNHYYFTFTAAAGLVAIVWDASITEWFVDGKVVKNAGEEPTLEAGKYYEVSVLNGTGAIMGV